MIQLDLLLINTMKVKTYLLFLSFLGGLESMLSHYMGDAKLSDCLTNVLVTSVKATSNEMVIFKSSNAFRDINEDFLLRNCARATSAAPTFFSAAEFNNLNGT